MNYTTFQLLSIAQTLLGNFSLPIHRGDKIILKTAAGYTTSVFTLVDETKSAFIVKNNQGGILTFSKIEYQAERVLYAE
jgi:hypothetical protein